MRAYLVVDGTLGGGRRVLDDGDRGGGEDDALDLGAVLLGGLQDTDGTLDGGAGDFRGVLPLPDDGGSGVDDTIDVLDGLIVCTVGLDVGDDDVLDLAGVFRESLGDELALSGRSDPENSKSNCKY